MSLACMAIKMAAAPRPLPSVAAHELAQQRGGVRTAWQCEPEAYPLLRRTHSQVERHGQHAHATVAGQAGASQPANRRPCQPELTPQLLLRLALSKRGARAARAKHRPSEADLAGSEGRPRRRRCVAALAASATIAAATREADLAVRAPAPAARLQEGSERVRRRRS